ncbi:hypothetical protein JX265_001142 [Neoarthrinium moseri]|uniref:Methyltransferase domain-containing protein n=1 Tax=Neoarthrinium moseri TaxID=1658444 RepID=A0A9Q0AU93_9PEZI|nr:uncharacterized protein JN550_007316 [Neoarthrinium moseri]KAI1866769.1 hypothetical protein JN550_007316 [Neoarthrinium moseri]KAI1880902.1 hypothetical protein JX265_001142 [Neoarthrinium moseri]
MTASQSVARLAQIIKAPSGEAVRHSKTVFLAGTTTGPPDWREMVSGELSSLPVTIFNPLRPDWDDSWTEDDFRKQVDWELSKQERADVVAVYFGANTLAPISLLELGLCAKENKAIVYVQDGYQKKGQVRLIYDVKSLVKDWIEPDRARPFRAVPWSIPNGPRFLKYLRLHITLLPMPDEFLRERCKMGEVKEENSEQGENVSQGTTGAFNYPDISATEAPMFHDEALATHYAQHSNAGPQLPFPSQLVPNYSLQAPPSALFSEEAPAFDPAFLGSSGHFDQPAPLVQPDFAKRANDLINASLGRTPGGTSVVEPDSVLEEWGRLYHGYKEGSYLLPNDAAEQDRLDLQHQVFLLLLDGWLHLAPMTRVPNFVLDIATGTGIWASSYSKRYPSSFVIGTDLSAIQPDPQVPNCVFQKDDAESPWVFPAPHPPDAHCVTYPCEHRIMFDYVHLRMVFTCFDDVRNVIRQAFDNMNSGGWIEFQDVVYDLRAVGYEGSPLQVYCDGMNRGAAARGRNLHIAKQYKAFLEEAGFVDVEERQFTLPWSPWPQDSKLRKAGLYNLQNCIEGLMGTGYKMLKLAGHSAQEVETIIGQTEAFVRDCRNRTWVPMYVVYGRKP